LFQSSLNASPSFIGSLAEQIPRSGWLIRIRPIHNWFWCKLEKLALWR
jgi:hypothetical protein